MGCNKKCFVQHMETDLKNEKLDVVINWMSKGKSPGLDGLTGILYLFWEDIREMLYNAFWNEFQLDTCLLS